MRRPEPPFFVTIVGPKGGVGKTALAVSLAALFARRKDRVWVVDLDPLAGATLALGQKSGGAALAAILGRGRKPVPVHVEGSLHLRPGGPELFALKKPRIPRLALATAPADLVILDCPPGASLLARAGLLSSGVILAACEPHRWALEATEPILQEVRALPRKTRCALVLGRVDGRSQMEGLNPAELAQTLGLPALTIHRDPRLAQAMQSGTLPPPEGRAAKDTRGVAVWLEGRTPV